MMQPEPAPTGSLDELRETVMQQLGLVSFHATLAVDQFSVVADAGGYYNARRATAHMRMAIETLKMLHERQAGAAREADERRADRGLGGAARRGESA